MAEREKVIRGLECCITDDPDDSFECKKCPYYRQGITNEPCFNALHADALALLKEQEARVMTQSEVENYMDGEAKDTFTSKPPLYVEQKHPAKFDVKWITGETVYSWCNDWEILLDYGKLWRCWSARPTEEQRKAAAWE